MSILVIDDLDETLLSNICLESHLSKNNNYASLRISILGRSVMTQSITKDMHKALVAKLSEGVSFLTLDLQEQKVS